MIVTARQLEDLHRAGGANGQMRLPVGARLTPLAQDWLRRRSVTLVYADASPLPSPSLPVSVSTECAVPVSVTPAAPPSAQQVLWWCDGPCGAAKAALAAEARQHNLQPMSVPAEPKHLVDAVALAARQIAAGQATAGVIVVAAGASAVVLANRCRALRAVLGTCRQSVEQGLADVAANVLVLEHPHHTLPQLRNMLGLFLARQRPAGESLLRQLDELRQM